MKRLNAFMEKGNTGVKIVAVTVFVNMVASDMVVRNVEAEAFVNIIK